MNTTKRQNRIEGWAPPSLALLRVMLLTACFLLLPVSAFANSAPVVSNIAVSQRTDGSKKVDVRYNLSDADGDRCTVSVQVSSDDGATWTVPAISFSGAIGAGIAPGTGKLITWDCAADLAGVYGTNYRIKVTADDGYEPPVGPDMVQIPGGTFSMGDSFNEGHSDERPVHTVSLDSFCMGKYEITNRQYCDYLNSALSQGLITVTSGVVYKAGAGTSYPYCDTSTSSSYSQIEYYLVPRGGYVFRVRTKGSRNMANDPMVMVSWYGAAAHCNWRSQQEGKQQCYSILTWNCDFSKKGYRLPTEAEWEYAARGGLSGKRFPWGDTISHSQANYCSYWEGGHPYYPYDVSTTEGYHPTWNDGIVPYTSPVGSFAANGYGLYDMAGNVWEWCNDWYGAYSSSPQTNPTGPTSGSSRVLRGGCWYGVAEGSRDTARAYYSPAPRAPDVGLRCVLGGAGPANGSAISGGFTIDNRNPSIIATSFNRIPAVIPQSSLLNPGRSTMPLKFSGELLPGGTAPADLGPLSVTARIQNPTQSSIKVKLKIKKYVDPAGNTHTKLFNGSYSETSYYRTIGYTSSSDLSLYVIPPTNTIGQWQVDLELYQKMGITALSEEKVASVPLTFMVKNPDEPTVQYPDFPNDALGNVLMPPEQITLTDTVWYVIFKNIDAMAAGSGVRGSAGASYCNYYEGWSDLLENIRKSAILKVKPKTIDNDVQYNITWYHSVSEPYNLGMDRAVILAYMPDGIASADLVDSGDAHVLESDGQIKGLMWLINGVDKRVWQTSGDKCAWIPRELDFKVRQSSIKGKKVHFSLQLQIGPFAGKNLIYNTLEQAPWVYNYSKWLTHPEEMYWYDIAVTDPVTIIDDSHQLTINRALDYFLISDAGSIFLPYECTPAQEIIVSWSDVSSPPDIPSGFDLVSSVRMFDTNPAVVLEKPATITLPFDYSGSQFEQLGIFRCEASTSKWLAVTTEIDTADSLASAKITEPGIYAVLDSGMGLSPVPDIILEFPVAGIFIQQRTPQFTWNDPIGDGWLYQVQVATAPDFSSPFADEICTEPNIVLAQWLEENTYHWRVRRLDLSGTVSRWATVATFTVNSDTTAPIVSDLEPTDGADITEGLPIISACVRDAETAIDPGSIIMTIDSEVVDCQFDGPLGLISYVSEGWLAPGDHTVSLVVGDVHGNETNVGWSFSITRYVNIAAIPSQGGDTIPGAGIYAVNSSELAIECEPNSGFKFVDWAIEPEDAGVIERPADLGSTVRVFDNVTITARFTSVADFTGSGTVAFEDLAIFCWYWLKGDCTGPFWCGGADLDNSGEIDSLDLWTFAQHWLWQAAWYSE